MYYLFVSDDKIFGAGECPILNTKVQCVPVTEEVYTDYCAVPEKYIYSAGNIIVNPNVEQELAEKEAKEKAQLHMLPLDFVNGLEELGVTFEQLEALAKANTEVRKQLRLCTHVYRGNPLLDELCGNFGVTPEQLDLLFKEKGIA